MVGTTETCGERMWMAFMATPTAPIDTGCLAEIRGHEFDREPSPLAQFFFGQRSLWENVPTGVPPLGPGLLTREEATRFRRELARVRREMGPLLPIARAAGRRDVQ